MAHGAPTNARLKHCDLEGRALCAVSSRQMPILASNELTTETTSIVQSDIAEYILQIEKGRRKYLPIKHRDHRHVMSRICFSLTARTTSASNGNVNCHAHPCAPALRPLAGGLVGVMDNTTHHSMKRSADS